MGLIADKCIFIFQARLAWAQQMQRHNIAYWRRVHWSDECRFILYKSDGRVRVWRRRVERFHPDCIQPRVAFGGGSVTLLTVIVLSLLSFCLLICHYVISLWYIGFYPCLCLRRSINWLLKTVIVHTYCSLFAWLPALQCQVYKKWEFLDPEVGYFGKQP